MPIYDSFGSPVTVLTNASYVSAKTLWSRVIPSNLAINSGTTFNILQTTNGLRESDKNLTATSTHDPYTITDSATRGIIVLPWAGVNLTHVIRVTGSFVNGGTEILRLELRRASDNSVLGTKQVGRNNDNSTWSVEFLTFTSGASDPFVTGGFYLAIASASGNGNVQLAANTTLSVLIFTDYENPRNL